MEDDKFDGLFMSVVQQSQGIEGFLSSFYGFLRRKTDFFVRPEEGKQMLLRDFEKNSEKFQETKRLEELKKKQAEEKKRAEEEARKAAPKVMEITDEEAEKISKEEEEKKDSPKKVEESKEENAEKGDEDDEEEKGLKPINNGGITDQYIWTQTLPEVTINFFIPNEVTGKQLKVDYTNTHISIKVKGAVHVEGEFYARVKADELVWTIDKLDGRKCVIVTADKFDAMSWWKSALKGDPEINTKKIEPENSKLSELDDEMRPTVEKMMIDQQRKAAGLPSLEDEKKNEMLQKFMKAHPEMDFSKAKFS